MGFERFDLISAAEEGWDEALVEGEAQLQAETKEDREALALERGEIELNEELRGGANETRLLKILDDGAAVFKPRDGEREGATEKGTGYKRERAAYVISSLFKFDLVPATIIREIDGQIGSVQEFVSNSKLGEELSDEDVGDKIKKMRLFDFLTANMDRHPGNYLVANEGTSKLWAIDHGATFGTESYELNDAVIGYEFDSELIERIMHYTASEEGSILRKELSELLSKEEIESFFDRLSILANNFDENRITEESWVNIYAQLKELYEQKDN